MGRPGESHGFESLYKFTLRTVEDKEHIIAPALVLDIGARGGPIRKIVPHPQPVEPRGKLFAVSLHRGAPQLPRKIGVGVSAGGEFLHFPFAPHGFGQPCLGKSPHDKPESLSRGAFTADRIEFSGI